MNRPSGLLPVRQKILDLINTIAISEHASDDNPEGSSKKNPVSGAEMERIGVAVGDRKKEERGKEWLMLLDGHAKFPSRSHFSEGHRVPIGAHCTS